MGSRKLSFPQEASPASKTLYLPKEEVPEQEVRSEPEHDDLPEKSAARTAALEAVRIAIEQRGLDVRGLDLAGVTDIADFFVIISGTSERHIQGIAEKIRLGLKELQEEPISITGYEQGEWVLLDYGDVVVHVFFEPTRQYYEFDELWKNAVVLELSPELEQQARRLHTGMIR